MDIVYESDTLIVVHKEPFVATQTIKVGEMDLFSEVKNYLAQKEKVNNPYLAIINRLDQPVEGLVLFAKTKEAAADLTRQLTENRIEKRYLARVYGTKLADQADLINYIKKDKTTNISYVSQKDDPDAKEAELSYTVKQKDEETALVEITLKTGRHHQIRVQFSHLGYPLVGDLKYGTPDSIVQCRQDHIRQIALCAYHLSCEEPDTKERKNFVITPFHNQLQLGETS